MSNFNQSKIQLVDIRKNDQLYPLKKQLCFIFPAYLDIGGVEFWFRSLIPVFNSEEYTIHAVTSTEIWRSSTENEMNKYSAFFNMRIPQMQLECDAILVTGYKPIIRRNQNDLHLLVIHGGSNCKWTQQYARYYKNYNAIVGVSSDSLSIVKSDFQNPTYTIPSTIIEQTIPTDLFEFKFCSKQLLYLGRISSEKNPDLFCRVVNQLSEEWCGVMVGPLYYTASLPLDCNKRIIIKPPTDKTQSYLKASSALFVASFEEGGPIVTIESWFVETPVFMFYTGLAQQYSEVIHVIPSKNWIAHDIAQFIEKNYQNDTIVQMAKKVYLTKFAPPIVHNLWRNVLFNLFDSPTARRIIRPIHVDLRTGGYVIERGRGRQLFCVDPSKFCTFSNTLKWWINHSHKFVTFYWIIENLYEDNVLFSLKNSIGNEIVHSFTNQQSQVTIKFNLSELDSSFSSEIAWYIKGGNFSLTLYQIELT